LRRFLLLYSRDPDITGSEILSLLERLVPREEIEIYCSIEELLVRLHKPHHDILVLILQVSDSKELEDFASIKPLLNDIKIILILTDRKADTVAAGHNLRPRFLTHKNNDLNEVKDVLTKMIGVKHKLYDLNDGIHRN
jgi:DNA-binding NarL/FixJ family response regulator